MKKIILFLVIVFMVISLTAQTVKDTSSVLSISKNTVFMDLGFGLPFYGKLFGKDLDYTIVGDNAQYLICLINFDRIFYNHKKMKISVRTGINTTTNLGGKIMLGNPYYFLLPVDLNFIVGNIANSISNCFSYTNKYSSNEHHFEIGFGGTYLAPLYNRNIFRIKTYGSSLFVNIRPLCYRFQQPNGGLFFKAGTTILYKIIDFKNEMLWNPNEYHFWIEFNIGYTFKNKKHKNK